MPAGFDGSDPDSYPVSGWLPYDRIVQTAAAYGITVDFTISGGAPRWAERPGFPPQGASPYYAWKPNAQLYGEFVQAVGERYDGSFIPKGESEPLPAVHFWALWNEPNFGQDLGPQALDGSRVSVAPAMYRALVNAGWSALQQTGHAGDTILIGEFAATGQSGRVTEAHPNGLPGYYGQTKPLSFIRTLYCVDGRYRWLHGSYARARGCPANGAGSRRFRDANPGLFDATGVGDHPYQGAQSPAGDGRRQDPSFAGLPELGRLESTLDRVNRAYRSPTRYPIYDDEYGYITSPPSSRKAHVNGATAAYYLNWSEYLSYRSPRVASYAQYLLQDPRPVGHVGFASGLISSDGIPKASLEAYRLPLYLPRTLLRAGRPAEVWGDVRPAPAMALDTAQTVALQQQPGGRGPWQTIETIPVSGAGGYFDLRIALLTGGRLRLAYTYPQADALLPADVAGSTIYSRVVSVKLRRP